MHRRRICPLLFKDTRGDGETLRGREEFEKIEGSKEEKRRSASGHCLTCNKVTVLRCRRLVFKKERERRAYRGK